MEQDIVIVTSGIEDFMNVHEVLNHNKIDVIQFNNVKDAKAGLIVHSPAFLLLDYDIKGREFLR